MNDLFNVRVQNNGNDLDIKLFDNFIENLLHNNTKIFLPCIVKDFLKNYDSSAETDEIIFVHLNLYLRKVRNNVRTYIRVKSDKNLVTSLLDIITNFGYKIYDLEYYSKENNFKNKCYTKFFPLIFSDPIIKQTLAIEIVNVNNRSEVKNLLENIKRIDSNFYNCWCYKFLRETLKVNCESIFQEADYMVPKYLLPFYEFSCLSDFLSRYIKCFNYIEDHNIFSDIFEKIINSIYKIYKNSNLILISSFLLENQIVLQGLIKKLNTNMRDEFESKTIYYVLLKFNKSELNSICKCYTIIALNYTKSLDSVINFLQKEIAKYITINDLFEDFNNILITKMNNDKYFIQLCSIIFHFEDKQKIFKSYHHNLMLRLNNYILEKNNTFIFKEMNNIEKLKRCFNNQYIYKLNRTVDDFNKSHIFKKNIIDILDSMYIVEMNKNPIYYKLIKSISNILVTSYDIWDTHILDNELVLDNIVTNENSFLLKTLKFISKSYFESHNEKRYLNWYLHVGSVKMSYDTNFGNIKLILLPIQALVLEVFDCEYLLLEKFFELEFLSSYEKDDRQKILDIFVFNEILILDGDKILLNMDLQSNSEISLIDNFFEVSNLTKKWNKQEEQDIANNKLDIIKTVLNHNLKKSDYNREELLKFCKEIYTFNVEEKMVDEAIEYMKKYDYIKYIDDEKKYRKLLY